MFLSQKLKSCSPQLDQPGNYSANVTACSCAPQTMALRGCTWCLAGGYPKRGRRRGKSSPASQLAHSFAQLFRVNIHVSRSGGDAFTAPPPPFRIGSSSCSATPCPTTPAPHPTPNTISVHSYDECQIKHAFPERKPCRVFTRHAAMAGFPTFHTFVPQIIQ